MKKRMSSSRKALFVAESAALLVAALALSYVESLIPLSFVPLPGFKLGLANIVTVIVFFRLSPLAAALISISRVVITSLLFTGVSSLMFALSGAVLSFIILIVLSFLLKDKISFIGISVVMALFHNAGQLIAASFLMKSAAVFTYFPALCLSSLICGCITGAILCAMPDAVTSGKDHTVL